MPAIISRANALDGTSDRDTEQELGSQDAGEEVTNTIRMLMVLVGAVSRVEDVGKVTKKGKARFPPWYTVALNQHWCFNHGKEHSNNRVYAMVSVS